MRDTTMITNTKAILYDTIEIPPPTMAHTHTHTKQFQCLWAKMENIL